MPEGPDYDKRVLDPALLIPNTIVRRYYSNGTKYDDYVIAGPVYGEGYGRRIAVRPLKDQTRTDHLYLTDMGITPKRGGQFHLTAYTIIIKHA